MITADNITNEQILGLMRDAVRRGTLDDLDTIVYCKAALGDLGPDDGSARARCAEILNARLALADGGGS